MQTFKQKDTYYTGACILQTWGPTENPGWDWLRWWGSFVPASASTELPLAPAMQKESRSYYLKQGSAHYISLVMSQRIRLKMICLNGLSITQELKSLISCINYANVHSAQSAHSRRYKNLTAEKLNLSSVRLMWVALYINLHTWLPSVTV